MGLGAWQQEAAGARAARGAWGSRWNPGKALSFVPLRPERVVEVRYDHLEGSRVMAALQVVVPDQREVLLLRMAAGLTAPEVAAALHKTTGAVKALQHRGLTRLAAVLGLHGPDLGDAAARLRAWLRRPQPPHRSDPTPGHQEGHAPSPTERADPRKR